ncbi:fibronectin type III domain-containing protein [Pleionea mediterranea]|uniref:Fibronectin type-III domain-containing protein n=1 Tax=Pleionea mediterranea TaxID=523701 RepID=A0A316G0Q4_9GAMM|nr:fibronectin type III domain-containing protein [Pleionea mediterranea]PWK54253.1 hypothetical protein C8D97_101101 [Pleionea mediterranea]
MTSRFSVSLTKKSWVKLFFIPLFLILSACSEQDGNEYSGDGDSSSGGSGSGGPGNSAPHILISSPASNSIFDDNESIVLIASADDTEDGDLSDSIEWRSSLDGDLGTGGQLGVDLSVGQHEVTASITDNGNQVNETSIVITINKAEAENTAPSLTIESPSNQSQAAYNESVELSATASDAEDGELSAAINWQSSRDGLLGNGASLNINLSVGEHTITASVEDSGSLMAEQSINIIVTPPPENSAPALVIHSPANNAQVDFGESVLFSASASDNEDGSLSQQINWSSSISGQLGVGASATLTLESGTHTITASVIDSGNLVSSQNIMLVVSEAPPENTAPVVSIVNPTNGHSEYQGSSISFNGNTIDQEQGSLTSYLVWQSNIDGVLGSGGSISSVLSLGTHTITASVMDEQGLQGQSQITVTILEANNTAPEISISSPTSGSEFLETDAVTLTATANDDEDGDLSSSIEWSSSIAGQLGTGSNLSVNLAVGVHTITAKVTDSDQAQSVTTTQITINEVVNVEPVINISSPTSGSEFLETDAVTLTATANDDEDGDLSSSIEWSSSIAGQLGTGSNLSVNLAVGVHTITAKVTDSDQAQSVTTTQVTINEVVNVAPAINITSPVSGSESMENDAVTLNAVANDEEDGVLTDSIEWQSNIDGALGTGGILIVNLTVGEHTITATVTDSEGVSNQSQIILTVNQIVNTAPEVTIVSPSTGSSASESESVSFVATANDAEDGDISTVIVWTSDLDGEIGQGSTIDVQLSVGNHIITATAADSEALSQQASIQFDVNPAADPTILSWVAPTQYTDNSALLDLAGFKIYYGTSEGNLIHSVSINDPSVTSYQLDQLQSNTTYYFAVTAIDSLGIESDYSATVSKIVQ